MPTSHFNLSTAMKALRCQSWANYSTWCTSVPNGVPIIQLFFESIFQFLNFSIMLNIFQAILESLSRKKKEFKFWLRKISLRKRLVNLKTLTSFSMEHVGLTSVTWTRTYVFIYLTVYAVSKKAYLEKNTSCTS